MTINLIPCDLCGEQYPIDDLRATRIYKHLCQKCGELTGEYRRTFSPSKEDTLRDLVYDAASILASVESDPREWAPWLILLAQSLETEAMQRNLDPDHPTGVELVFERLQNALADRLKNHRW